MRTLPLALLLTAVSIAAEKPQIDWVRKWDAAFKQAIETGKPVMVCINSKDGETANETTAKKIYRDPLFVALSRKFVMVLISTREHAKEGTCPRFGAVTCQQHLDCWKELSANYGEKFIVPGSGGDMISPQHAWFTPDGTLLRRKEYFLDKGELTKRMRAVLSAAKRTAGPGAEEGTPGKNAPLDGKDKAALERLKHAGDREARAAALGNLLATDKIAVHAALGGGSAEPRATGRSAFTIPTKTNWRSARGGLPSRSEAGFLPRLSHARVLRQKGYPLVTRVRSTQAGRQLGNSPQVLSATHGSQKADKTA